MVVPTARGSDLFKIVGRSIWGPMKRLKTGTAFSVQHLLCRQFAERLLQCNEQDKAKIQRLVW